MKYVMEVNVDSEIKTCMHCKFHKCSKEKANVYCKLLSRNLVGATAFDRNRDCPLKEVKNDN